MRKSLFSPSLHSSGERNNPQMNDVIGVWRKRKARKGKLGMG